MNIKAADIKKRDFPKSFRGYDPNEVEAFLETVSAHYEKLVLEISSLNEKVKSLSSDIEIYKENEINLQRALIRTQDIGEEIIENSKKRAQNIIRESELNAQKLRQSVEEEIINKRTELEELKAKNEKLTEDTKTFFIEKLSEIDDYIKNKRVYKMELASTKMMINDMEEKQNDVNIAPYNQNKLISAPSRGGFSDPGLTSRPFDDNFEIK
ncbi:hypothetical protein BH10BAC5_BH10BAC5_19070 [soil metagenome]